MATTGTDIACTTWEAVTVLQFTCIFVILQQLHHCCQYLLAKGKQIYGQMWLDCMCWPCQLVALNSLNSLLLQSGVFAICHLSPCAVERIVSLLAQAAGLPVLPPAQKLGCFHGGGETCVCVLVLFSGGFNGQGTVFLGHQERNRIHGCEFWGVTKLFY